MAAVYDFATKRPLPVEDPSCDPDAFDPENMTEGERRAYWHGFAQAVKDYAAGSRDTLMTDGEADAFVRMMHARRRSHLEVAR